MTLGDAVWSRKATPEPSLSSQLTESRAGRALVLCQLSHGVVIYLAAVGLCCDFSLEWLLLWSTGSTCVDFGSCDIAGLVAPWHVGSSWTRD